MNAGFAAPTARVALLAVMVNGTAVTVTVTVNVAEV